MTRREQDALLALFNSFRPSRRVTTFDQLSDGKVLLEVMHSIDGTHFKGGPKSHARTSGSGATGQDNWVLRMNIMKRLYRLMLSYPLNHPNAPTLAVTTLPEPNFNAIARLPKSAEGTTGLIQICRMCVAVGAMGPANERVIAKIQALDEGSMVELMKTIEGVMATLPNGHDGEESQKDTPHDVSPPNSALREERDRLLSENDDLRTRIEGMTEQVQTLNSSLNAAKESEEAYRQKTLENDATRTKDGPSETDNLRADLARAEDGLAETEAALEKQTTLVAELTRSVDELRATATDVGKLQDEVDELRQVEDRLHKSENVIEKYKKKLEEGAGLRRELRTLEEENAALIDKNSHLEGDLKKLGANKSLVDHYKGQIDALEKKAHDQAAEFAHLSVQLEEVQESLAAMERERDMVQEELQASQERVKELEHAPKRHQSMLQISDKNLEIELEHSDSEDNVSKTDLKLRIRALERQLADNTVPGDQADRMAALEQLLTETEKARERYQTDYMSANRQAQLAQAKLEHILTGRGGDNTQTALALRQRLDDVSNERDTLRKDKQAAEDAHEDLVRQLTSARFDLGLVDKDKRSIIASARSEAKTETVQFSEQVTSLKDELATLRERDRLHLEEIRRLMMDKIELQSVGMAHNQEALERERKLNDLRTSLETTGTSPHSQAQILDLQTRNDVLTTEVASLSDKLKKARAFIKNQDALFRAEHHKKLSTGFTQQGQDYESKIAALKNELSVAKHNALSIDSRYRLEQQLMLAAWHDLGARVVRDHVGAAGLRRPAVQRAAGTSWLARQRKHQDDALFAR
ncbi:hypothetical protein CcaverHIS002_0701810 [Cutaneotrichosporon cavernicola]|nr:hypothetical protein CcaverHIS002_0701810 [Cutaneotrichosporon cavernicola]BEJ02388.1 hypothetical protein CcaverHIS631_0701830 [Cutaneotrichosporon cavernicola]BEJ10146.1 hypothetical protein CcaverHIS641_0701810 [Cutaneotrichosporon cavernicola]